RRPAASGRFNFPRDIVVRAPPVGQVWIVGHAERAWAAELGPVRGGRGGARSDGEEDYPCDKEYSEFHGPSVGNRANVSNLFIPLSSTEATCKLYGNRIP